MHSLANGVSPYSETLAFLLVLHVVLSSGGALCKPCCTIFRGNFGAEPLVCNLIYTVYETSHVSILVLDERFSLWLQQILEKMARVCVLTSIPSPSYKDEVYIYAYLGCQLETSRDRRWLRLSMGPVWSLIALGSLRGIVIT